MAWCRQAPSHYLSQCWPRSLSPYGVTRPQRVDIQYERGYCKNCLQSSAWRMNQSPCCKFFLFWSFVESYCLILSQKIVFILDKKLVSCLLNQLLASISVLTFIVTLPLYRPRPQVPPKPSFLRQKSGGVAKGRGGEKPPVPPKPKFTLKPHWKQGHPVNSSCTSPTPGERSSSFEEVKLA